MDFPVTCIVGGEDRGELSLQLTAVDLSSTGLSVRAEAPRVRSSKLLVAFHLPDQERRFVVNATVARVIPRDDGYVWGLSFDDLGTDERAEIGRYVLRQLALQLRAVKRADQAEQVA